MSVLGPLRLKVSSYTSKRRDKTALAPSINGSAMIILFMITGSCCFTQHSVEFYVIFDYRYSPWFVDNTSSLNDTSAENVRIGDASLG